MANKRLIGLFGAALTAYELLTGNGLYNKNLDAQERERTTDVIRLPGESEYDLYKHSVEEGKKVDVYLGRIKVKKDLTFSRIGSKKLESRTETPEDRCLGKLGLFPGKYIVKPHPYKEGTLLIVKDNSEENKEQKKNNGVYRSTGTHISYPDGRMEDYGPLGPNQSLEDLMKDGPRDSFLPIPGIYNTPSKENRVIPIESLPSVPNQDYQSSKGKPVQKMPNPKNATTNQIRIPTRSIRENLDGTFTIY